MNVGPTPHSSPLLLFGDTRLTTAISPNPPFCVQFTPVSDGSATSTPAKTGNTGRVMRFQFSVRCRGRTGWKLRLYDQRSLFEGDPCENTKLFWKLRLQMEDTGLLSCLLISSMDP